MIAGGTSLNDVPRPLIRAFDDKRRKRKVTPSVLTWIGTMAFDAKHYHPALKEEDNPILLMDEYPPGNKRWLWTMCRDDEEGKGRVLHGPRQYTTESDAWAWCKRTVQQEFPNHKVYFEHPEDRKRYQEASA
jgi:hypothetical protein